MKPTPFILQACAVSDVGGRANNEDTYLINHKIGLFLVADGMGGHSKGDVASQFTSENVEKILSSAVGSEDDTLNEISFSNPQLASNELIQHAVYSINLKLYNDNEKEAAKYMDMAKTPEQADYAATMARKCRKGTTLVSLLVRGELAYLTHIGDSRAYRIEKDCIQKLTEDHSWVGEHVRTGEISVEEAKTHKKKNLITRSVGIKQDLIAEMDVLTIHPPQRYLLCSDGLCGVVDDESMLALAKIENLREACEKMVLLAKERGGRDNITALIVDVIKSDTKETCDGKFKEDTIL